MKLAQANMELMSKYAFSPEVMSEATRSVQVMLEQSQESFMRLGQSQAFPGLIQGLAQNYTEFVTELAQSAYAAMSQGQAALMQQAIDASSNVVQVAARGGRRSAT